MYAADGKLLSSGRWINDELQPAFDGKALLIGNNRYDAPVNSLRCCRNDATDMQSALTQLGFQCTLLLDATKRQITDAIATFVCSLQRPR